MHGRYYVGNKAAFNVLLYCVIYDVFDEQYSCTRYYTRHISEHTKYKSGEAHGIDREPHDLYKW